MISIKIVNPPRCLAGFASRSPLPRFDAPAFQSCKNQIRTQLLLNQLHQCAYCERPIEDCGDSSHLDHIESQYDNQARRFDITNLVAACQTSHTCGHAHGRHSVPAELDPYRSPGLHSKLSCHSSGELEACGLSAAAEEFALGAKGSEAPTLNLNDPGLISRRELIIVQLMQQTVALGTNAKRKLRSLSTHGVGFQSLHYQYLARFGFPTP